MMHRTAKATGDRNSLRWQLQCLERSVPNVPAEAFLITGDEPILDGKLLVHFRSEPVVIWRSRGLVVPPFGAGHEEAEKAIEHAVMDLGVREIAICGHLPCEATRTLLDEDEGSDDDSARYYAQVTRRIVQEKYGRLSEDELLQAMVEENVFVQLANLRTHPAVLTGLARGDLQVHTWIYDVDKDVLYSHGSKQSALLKRNKRFAGPEQPALPHLNPCDIYLA